MIIRSILSVLVAAIIPIACHAQSRDIPGRTNDNIIVASYNIKWLDQQEHNYDSLAAVIQHFDVCGIIEVKAEGVVATLVEALERRTERDWGYTFGIRTHRPGGRYHEAYAAVWRKDRVELGDGITSNIWDLEEAFRNDPYIVSFKRRNFDFCLILVHTRWSDDGEGSRANEVAMIAEHILWMQEFLNERDIIVAGDFDYSGTAEAMRNMAEDAGLVQIDPNHNSTFKSDYSGYANSYDHIYVIAGETNEYVDGSSRVMDTTQIIYGSSSRENMRRSKRELSDHLPVWAVFNVAQVDDD